MKRNVDQNNTVSRGAASERKAEQVSDTSDTALKALFNSVMDAIVTIDARGRITALNSATLKMFGFTEGELHGADVSALIPEPHRSRHHQYIEDYLRTGVRKIIGRGRELNGQRKDGSIFPIHLTVTEADVGGEQHFIGMVRDMTRQKEAENQVNEMMGLLDQQNKGLLEILNNLELGICFTDDRERVVFVSDFCSQMFQVDKAHWIGKSCTEVFPFEGDLLSRLRMFCHRSSLPIEEKGLMWVTPKSERAWVDLKILPHPQNRAERIFVFTDVTELHKLRSEVTGRSRLGEIVGGSKPMQVLYQKIQTLASRDTTVLIEGETGTGKELIARELHKNSERKSGPFIPVNCAGLTDTLLSSQLFGHIKGAFTGATEQRKGIFEAAHQGTVFLDEVGDIPLAQQTALLRVLEQREVTRLGETTPRKVDVRIIAATNVDLMRSVELKSFRADLLYRLRVAIVRPPALREHRDDLPLLVEHILRSMAPVQNGKPLSVHTSAMKCLALYDWPGNVRQLRNALESALVQCRDGVIRREDLPDEIQACGAVSQGEKDSLHCELTPVARIRAALQQTDGNCAAAARILGIGRTTLYRRMKKYKLQ